MEVVDAQAQVFGRVFFSVLPFDLHDPHAHMTHMTHTVFPNTFPQARSKRLRAPVLGTQ